MNINNIREKVKLKFLKLFDSSCESFVNYSELQKIIESETNEEILIKYKKISKYQKISSIIEQSIYNYVINLSNEKNIIKLWDNHIFLELYLSKVRTIYTNLDETSYVKNVDLKSRILNNKIDIHKIAEISMYDIFPDNWKYLLEKKAKSDKLKMEYKPEAMTDQYKCRKCGSRSTSYYEVQTRSADEPMTQFITCLNCGCRWKQ
mgnify:CR=1 FL=1|tara:strand:+ start:196 stop:810 length:615 start_codon:yes stop_codon:yes gene_type:complete